MRRKYKLKKLILLGLISIFIVTILAAAIDIYTYGNIPKQIKAEAAIVLGAEVWAKEPSPVFRERINHAINLYKKADIHKIIFTGGIGAGKELSEAEVGKNYAIRNGVTESHILIEVRSRTTYQNIENAKQVALSVFPDLQSHKFLIVSDPLHLKRAVMMARDLGFDAYPSATLTTRYRSFKSQLEFLVRETYFYFVYLIFKT
ncbi:YdcF family protein [Brunnivagina elsteri]|uniref:Protein sanA-like protein n=1 Tax=Brunnivagina elsteri CCALA 953 TaxID=987040 RepID=A0A2A2TKR8_9CYAN|nr:YdcF family protein [Calothrix elsteri]PAX57173.1 protein sanA-like protein [Calothrix elsteri CCALA 953]